nr:hypothetical protein [Pseudomonas asturiensis]
MFLGGDTEGLDEPTNKRRLIGHAAVLCDVHEVGERGTDTSSRKCTLIRV